MVLTEPSPLIVVVLLSLSQIRIHLALKIPSFVPLAFSLNQYLFWFSDYRYIPSELFACIFPSNCPVFSSNTCFKMMAAVLGDFIKDVCFSCLWYHSAQFQVATSSCKTLRHRNDAFGRILLTVDTPTSKSFWACYLGWNSHSYYLVSNSQLLSSPRSTKQVLHLKLHIETNPVCNSKQPEECKCLRNVM